LIELTSKKKKKKIYTPDEEIAKGEKSYKDVQKGELELKNKKKRGKQI